MQWSCSQRVHAKLVAAGHSNPIVKLQQRLATSIRSVPLTVAQIEEFCVSGFICLQPSVKLGTHESVVAELDKLKERGNNILAAVPDLWKIIEAPEIVGGLETLVGPGYAIHPHRHAHITKPGRRAQQLHRDSYFGFEQHRHHVPVWLMLLYFPQHTTCDMGPTSLVPGSQYYAAEGKFDAAVIQNDDVVRIMQNWSTQERIGEQGIGSVILMHYDIWHRAAANTAAKPGRRWMVKFQFFRTAPRKLRHALAPAFSTSRCSLIANWVAAWISGSHLAVPPPGNDGRSNAESVEACSSSLLSDSCDHQRIPSAYDLALAHGHPGKWALMHILQEGRFSTQILRAVRYGLAAALEQELVLRRHTTQAPLVDALLEIIRCDVPSKAACALASLETVSWNIMTSPQRLRAVKTFVTVLENCIGAHHAARTKLRAKNNVAACAAATLGFAGQVKDVQAIAIRAIAVAITSVVRAGQRMPPDLPQGEILMASTMAAVRLSGAPDTIHPQSRQQLVSACLAVVRRATCGTMVSLNLKGNGAKPSGDHGLRYSLAHSVEALVRLADENAIAQAYNMLAGPGQLPQMPLAHDVRCSTLRERRWCHFTTKRCSF